MDGNITKTEFELLLRLQIRRADAEARERVVYGRKLRKLHEERLRMLKRSQYNIRKMTLNKYKMPANSYEAAFLKWQDQWMEYVGKQTTHTRSPLRLCLRLHTKRDPLAVAPTLVISSSASSRVGGSSARP